MNSSSSLLLSGIASKPKSKSNPYEIIRNLPGHELYRRWCGFRRSGEHGVPR